MSVTYSKIKNSEDEYELLINGEIGNEISGAQISDAIAYLNRCGAKLIKERLNSIGGSVIDAYGIVAANVQSKAIIETINEGVADSCAFWIMVSGNQGSRNAFDYASSLVHNPSLDGVSLDDISDEKDKKEMTIIRDSIVTIVANNSGQTPEKIKELMSSSVRLSAKQLKEYGFIDNIVKSKNKPLIKENMSALQIMNVCKSDVQTKETSKHHHEMDKINAYLGLNSEATEDAALSEIRKRVDDASSKIVAAENKAKDAEQQAEQLKKDLNKAKETNTALEAKVKETENAAIESVVNKAIEEGKFAIEEKESLVSKAKNIGLENFSFMVEKMATPAVDVAGKITNKGGVSKTQGNEAELAKSYDEAYKSGKLNELKNANPTQFANMEAAWAKIQ